MHFIVDPWDPSYGTALDESDDDSPAPRSNAELDADVEIAAEKWHPIAAPPDLSPPGVVLFADGVRRREAVLWIGADERLGVAASYAAGVVRCDTTRGTADVVIRAVERGIFTAAADAEDLWTQMGQYVAFRTGRGAPSDLMYGLQRQMQILEVKVSNEARDAFTDDLMVVDGQLDARRHLPNVLGYIKTQRTSYLPPRLSAVAGELTTGQRTPVFHISRVWPRFTWYLRLPGPTGAAWSGIVRIECSAELSVDRAVALADISAATIPRFASVPYKDPRAPQNLVPIAGLERRLRGMLGDARLLHRSLLRAAATAGLPGGAG